MLYSRFYSSTHSQFPFENPPKKNHPLLRINLIAIWNEPCSISYATHWATMLTFLLACLLAFLINFQNTATEFDAGFSVCNSFNLWWNGVEIVEWKALLVLNWYSIVPFKSWKMFENFEISHYVDRMTILSLNSLGGRLNSFISFIFIFVFIDRFGTRTLFGVFSINKLIRFSRRTKISIKLWRNKQNTKKIFETEPIQK